MPLNLNPFDRFWVINDCLCHHIQKHWSKEALIDKILVEVGVLISERSLIADIWQMRNSSQLRYYAPIKYSRAYKGYYYADTNYSIDKLPLTATDIKALKLAASTLSQYRNIPLLRELTDTIDKVVQIVDRGKITEGSIFSCIDFERTPFAKGTEHMELLIEAIQNKKCLVLTYKKFGSVAEEFDIHPYILKEYRKRWYVIAYNEQKRGIRIYGLDRVLSLNASVCDYKLDPSITKNYLGDCIGINTGNHKIENVVLKFIPSEGHYLKTQAMHKSQETLSDTKSGLVIRIKVIINFELIGIILGYGAKVTVMEPKILADKIVEIAHSITTNYPR